mgnify:CR=1 FL=1
MANSKLRSIWEQRLIDQKNSGKNIRDWCRDNSIKENRFYYWRRELQSETNEPKEKLQWLPVEIENPEPSPAITVTIGIAKIEIPPNFNQEQLRQVIQVLKNI